MVVDSDVSISVLVMVFVGGTVRKVVTVVVVSDRIKQEHAWLRMGSGSGNGMGRLSGCGLLARMERGLMTVDVVVSTTVAIEVVVLVCTVVVSGSMTAAVVSDVTVDVHGWVSISALQSTTEIKLRTGRRIGRLLMTLHSSAGAEAANPRRRAWRRKTKSFILPGRLSWRWVFSGLGTST